MRMSSAPCINPHELTFFTLFVHRSEKGFLLSLANRVFRRGQRSMKKALAVVVFSLACGGNSYAQAVAGSGAVAGTVRDASGAVVPSATVVVSNDAKGIKRNLQTTDAGVFSAPALVPADGYSVTVRQPGFSKGELKAVAL